MLLLMLLLSLDTILEVELVKLLELLVIARSAANLFLCTVSLAHHNALPILIAANEFGRRARNLRLLRQLSSLHARSRFAWLILRSLVSDLDSIGLM